MNFAEKENIEKKNSSNQSQQFPTREIKLDDSERQSCEVYTRVMGYFRPVSFFNIGKKQEYLERKNYIIPNALQNKEKTQ